MSANDKKPDVHSLDIGKTAEFPPGMAPKMLNLLKMVDTLERDLGPLVSQPYHEVLNKMSSLERAKIGMMEIYTINSLFWVLMRTSGENIDATLRDDYKIEMGRLREAQGRIAEIEARAHRQRLDTQAASRFIEHGLGIRRRNRNQEADDEQEEEEMSPSHLAKKRQRLAEEEEAEDNEESYSEGESENEEDSDEDNTQPTGESDQRSWYGQGW